MLMNCVVYCTTSLQNLNELLYSYFSRCIFTTIDRQTGKKDPNMEPLRTLRKYVYKEGMNIHTDIRLIITRSLML